MTRSTRNGRRLYRRFPAIMAGRKSPRSLSACLKRNSMKILSIGSDRTLFEEGSEAQRRQREYAALFEELHVVVFSARSTNYESRITNGRLQIAENAWVYSTDSKSRWHYVFESVEYTQFIIPNSVVTCQDP